MSTAAAIIARNSLSVLGLAFVDSHTLRIALCAVILALDARAYQVLCSSHLESMNGYILGCAIFSGTMITPYLLALTPNPRKTFRWKNSPGPQTKYQKLRWAIWVHSSPRLIGLENEAAKIPDAQSLPRLQFVVRQLRHIILGGMIGVAAWFPVIWFNLLDFIHPANGRLPDLTQEAIRRLWTTILCLYTSFYMLNTHYEISSIFFVVTGLTEPKDWPDYSGPIFAGTTLAKCWGVVWHQTFRAPFSAYGDFVAQMVGAPQGSQIWWCIKVIIAFTLSTWVHAGGDYVMSKGRVWWSPQFFMAQPFALILEAAVIRVADRYRFRRRFPITSTIFGYIWVFSWFSLTYPDFIHELWIMDLLAPFRHATPGPTSLL